MSLNQFKWIHKKYSTYYTSIKSSQVTWYCKTHSSCLSVTGVQTHLFYNNQVTDTLNFRSRVKHGLTLTNTFTEQQNMVQWKSPNLPCTITPLGAGPLDPKLMSNMLPTKMLPHTQGHMKWDNLFLGKAETECWSNFEKNWEPFIYGDKLYYLIL